MLVLERHAHIFREVVENLRRLRARCVVAEQRCGPELIESPHHVQPPYRDPVRFQEVSITAALFRGYGLKKPIVPQKGHAADQVQPLDIAFIEEGLVRKDRIPLKSQGGKHLPFQGERRVTAGKLKLHTAEPA